MFRRSGCAAIAHATVKMNEARMGNPRPVSPGWGFIAKVIATNATSTTTPNSRHAIASSGAVPSPSYP